jgi:hypothetical protein
MHVESHAVTGGGGSGHETLEGTKSRNIETGLASRPAYRRLSHFTLVYGYD